MSADSPPSPPPDSPAETRRVRAVYRGGVVAPEEAIGLPDGTHVEIVIPTRLTYTPSNSILAELSGANLIVLAASLLLYLATRLIGLTFYPIYFFCDEAIQTTLARQLLNNGLRSADDTFLPPYFFNAEKWSLSLSVYIQAMSAALFSQNSVLVTRGTSVAVSVLALVAVALTLRLVFNNRFWWAGPLILTAAPAWFLHSRTAFETVMMVAFYACFLCCYLLYRTRAPGWLVPALAFGAMTFYAYANGQGVMLVTGTLLFCSDLRYHLRQGWRTISAASGTLLLLLIPLVRFRLLEPDSLTSHLRVLDSYWTHSIPLSEKLKLFGETYLTGVGPWYWFLPNTVDLDRHRMLGMGHFPLWLLPFVLIGLGVSLRKLRSPSHRALLIAVLAAPFSSALAGISVTRVLAMVVPVALLASLGIDQCYSWIAGRIRYTLAAALVSLVLSGSSLWLLRSALVDGPTWFPNYTLDGMQYGAEQVFGEAIPNLLARDADTQLLVSPTWANNPNAFVDFFLTKRQASRVQLINIDAFAYAHQALDSAHQIFIMPTYEYDRAIHTNKFLVGPPEQIIPYPDGTPGFYVVRIGYVENVDALFEVDRIARAQLVEDQVELGGPMIVAHSLLDIGGPVNLFDGDPSTLMRGFEANPLIVELRFPQPRMISGVTLTVASMDLKLRVIGTPVDGSPEISAEQSYSGLPPDPTVQLDLPGPPHALSKLRLEINQLGVGEITHVHVRELVLR